MKRFLIIALVVLSFVLPMAAFAQTMAPATPIAPEAPQAPPATIGPSQPIAPTPAPAPAAVPIHKDWWLGMSVDVGTPYTGPTSKMYMGLTIAGKLFVYTPPNMTIDALLNGEVGFTPFHLGAGTDLGLLLRGTIGLSYSDFGSYDYYIGSLYLGSESYSAFSDWFAISPMLCMKFRLNGNNYIVIGAGYGYYNYSSTTFNFSGDLYNSSSATNWTTANGWQPVALIEMNTGGFITEIGLTGPDVYAGLGFAF